jgi:hypothetical protein
MQLRSISFGTNLFAIKNFYILGLEKVKHIYEITPPMMGRKYIGPLA